MVLFMPTFACIQIQEDKLSISVGTVLQYTSTSFLPFSSINIHYVSFFYTKKVPFFVESYLNEGNERTRDRHESRS